MPTAPNTTDWIIAGTSIAAAIGTVGTLYATVTILRRQEDDGRRSQASRIIFTQRADTWPPVFDILNGSDQAIYGAALYIQLPDGVPTNGDDEALIVRPGETAMLITDATLDGYDPPDADSMLFAAIFSDELGRSWMRKDYGVLEEMKTPIIFTSDLPFPRRLWVRWKRRQARRKRGTSS